MVKLIKTGNNAHRVDLGPNETYWFSYETVVAFQHPDAANGRIIVSENVWGPTTGKHINAIDGGAEADKCKRLPRADFVALLESVAS